MQRESQGGSAVENGRLWGARARDWAEVQEGMLEPVFAAVLARTGIGPATRYLDIGCGAGRALQLAGRRGARAAGLDASPALLEHARRRSPGADLRLGDMQDLPFDERSFDVVSAINALQYADDPARALAQARRVLRPGGILAVVTWSDTENMEAARFNACLRPLLPPPPADAPHPFNLSEPEALAGLLRGAGLVPGESFEIEAPWHYPDRATALRGVLAAGVVVRAMEVLGEATVRAAYERALDAFARPDGSYRIGATFRCLLAGG